MKEQMKLAKDVTVLAFTLVPDGFSKGTKFYLKSKMGNIWFSLLHAVPLIYKVCVN